MVDDLLEARMVSCNLTYGPEGDRNSSRLVTNFLPKHRWQGGLEVARWPGGGGRVWEGTARPSVSLETWPGPGYKPPKALC